MRNQTTIFFSIHSYKHLILRIKKIYTPDSTRVWGLVTVFIERNTSYFPALHTISALSLHVVTLFPMRHTGARTAAPLFCSSAFLALLVASKRAIGWTCFSYLSLLPAPESQNHRVPKNILQKGFHYKKTFLFLFHFAFFLFSFVSFIDWTNAVIRRACNAPS